MDNHEESQSSPPDGFDSAHDTARYLYEARNNWGLVRADNGGIRMSEAHHSDGWEEGFMDGWRARKEAGHSSAAPDGGDRQ